MTTSRIDLTVSVKALIFIDIDKTGTEDMSAFYFRFYLEGISFTCTSVSSFVGIFKGNSKGMTPGATCGRNYF